MRDNGLLIHWLFNHDFRATAGDDLSAHVESVTIEEVGAYSHRHSAAIFDGRRSIIRVDHHDRLNTDDAMTIAAWVHTETHLPGVVGDIASKFDFARRCGWTLGVIDNQGVASSQANYRNLHWGMDDGGMPGRFTPTGALGAARLIWALTVHENGLYAGTCEPDGFGRVWQLQHDNNTWTDLGHPDDSNSVVTMASLDGDLYVGTGSYRTWGSNLPPASNSAPGGHVYVMQARHGMPPRWQDCGRVSDGESVNALTVYDGELYAADFYAKGVFVMERRGVWRSTGLDRRVVALTGFDGALWAMLMDGGQIMRYRPDDGWEQVVDADEVTQMYGGAVHCGRLYVGGFPRAWTFRVESDHTLTRLGHPGHEAEMMGMALYNGKLYGGTLPLANVYRFDEHRPSEFEGWSQAWNVVDTVDNTPGVSVRRAWSLCVHQGSLYCGTLPGGHVGRFNAGRMASWDRALPGGWRHIAAVRDAKELRLYVDGREVARSATFAPDGMNIGNTAPLLVGMGGHAPFRGAMRDFRLYGRALTPLEIDALAALPHAADAAI